MVVLLGWGLTRLAAGTLPTHLATQPGMQPLGHSGDGLLMGASLFVVLHAFASGGAAVTGVEAISNGVPAFRKPEWRNARTTLVIMGSTLGAMFLGLSVLGAHMKVMPYVEGTPTVISQIGRLVYGAGPLGHTLFYALQAGTMLILVLAANTSFADFPRLASFHAGDNFMPRWLTKRGHRLVFSNGIVGLAGSAVLLIVVTEAKVDQLIPLYAIGVFTSFTLSQAGMARHHIREKEPHWRWGLLVNGIGAVLSAVVDVIIAITKFSHGAWVIVVLVPVMVVFLVRLARQYELEGSQLEHGVPEAVTTRVLRRHVVLVFVDTLDLASARAIQYARALNPEDVRAVHFVIDAHHAEALSAEWQRLGLLGIPLEIVDCPDRRLSRCAVETVARDLADGETEVTVLLPERKYRGFWHRILHDQTAEDIERNISLLPHANVTTVPFHFDTRRRNGNGTAASALLAVPTSAAPTRPRPNGGSTPIGDVRCRQYVRVEGRIRSVRVQPRVKVPTLECVLVDQTGALSVIFLGRRGIPGIEAGAHLRAEGMAGKSHGRLALLNPQYELLPSTNGHH
jgi:hypothetical protein